MDADHQGTRRKILDLHSRKIGIGLLTLKVIITTLEVATRTEGKAGAEARIDLCIACIIRGI
jgi:hypothetical protein